MEIATEILKQLGGNKFIVMTGSKNLVAGKNSLSMKLSRNESKANHLKIELTPMDVYSMKFISIRGGNMKIVEKYDNVYCDQLQNIFTKETGLYTKL